MASLVRVKLSQDNAALGKIPSKKKARSRVRRRVKRFAAVWEDANAPRDMGTNFAREWTMDNETIMAGGQRSSPGARTAPRGSGSRRTVVSAIFFCLVAFPTAAFEAVGLGVDTPVQESALDAPPGGETILPGLTFSGYATVQFLAPDARGRSQVSTSTVGEDEPQYSRHPRLNLSHLSGIAWWEPAPDWKVLGEIDLQDIVQLPAHSGQDGPDSEPYAALDRLYADYRLSDALTVRAGKFLTPIGRWNQQHSDPQVWTVLRPLISESAFPTTATGLMVFGSLPLGAQWIDYQTYASDGGEWRPSPRSHPFNRAFGGRVSTSLNPALQLGLSASRFTQDGVANSDFSLLGADVSWIWGGAELSAELIQRRGRDANVGEEHGWFAQAVLPIRGRWWGVARLEQYRRALDQSESRTALLGVVYRSEQHWVFKAEWARASGSSEGLPSGLLSSLTLVY